jgi:hypothetical protein
MQKTNAISGPEKIRDGDRDYRDTEPDTTVKPMFTVQVDHGQLRWKDAQIQWTLFQGNV